jgi:hypothetical protein
MIVQRHMDGLQGFLYLFIEFYIGITGRERPGRVKL